MKKSKKFFFGFRTFDLGVVWYRLLYGKSSIWTGLKGSKHHMAILFDLRHLWLSDGSTCHFWLKTRFCDIFFKYRKSSHKSIRWPYKYKNLIKDIPNDFPTHYHHRFFREKFWKKIKISLRNSLRIFTCIRKSLRKL